MVIGLDKFREQFAGDEDKYIIIGGTACDVNLRDTQTQPRDTVDIDIILIVENMTADFGRKFWKFIDDGGYHNRSRKRGEGKEPVPELFRFLKPDTQGYPQQIELLSIHPDILGEPTGFHLTPIPVGENIPSLSAIIMDKEYYDFTLSRRKVIDGLSVADFIALLCLKATAFVNLSIQKSEDPSSVQGHDIRKHRDDVFKLLSAVGNIDTIKLPENIKSKVETFTSMIEESCNDKDFLKSMERTLRIERDAILEYMEQLKEMFV